MTNGIVIGMGVLGAGILGLIIKKYLPEINLTINCCPSLGCNKKRELPGEEDENKEENEMVVRIPHMKRNFHIDIINDSNSSSSQESNFSADSIKMDCVKEVFEEVADLGEAIAKLIIPDEEKAAEVVEIIEDIKKLVIEPEVKVCHSCGAVLPRE